MLTSSSGGGATLALTCDPGPVGVACGQVNTTYGEVAAAVCGPVVGGPVISTQDVELSPTLKCPEL